MANQANSGLAGLSSLGPTLSSQWKQDTKVSARIANHRNLQLPNQLHYVLTHSLLIG